MQTKTILSASLLSLFLVSSQFAFATSIGADITTANLTASGLKITSGATNNYILTSDASGNATWISVGTALANATTDDLSEGSTNKYYDTADVDSRVTTGADARISLQKAAANGLATLDSGGKVPSNQLPSLTLTNSFVVVDEPAMLALSAEVGDIAIRTDVSKTFILSATPASNVSNWFELLSPTSGVQSFNSRVGAVVPAPGDYTNSDVGLGNVTNALQLVAANNLSDLTSPSSARTNIGLGNLTNALQLVAANNLSDLTSPSSARTNIGLGSVTNDAQVKKADFTAKGDILVGTSSAAYTALAVGSNGQVLVASSTTATGLAWGAAGGAGSVTSVDASGGTTGLTFSGGPITNSGTLTLAGTLGIANGGTGSTTKTSAFNALSPLTTLGDLLVYNGSNNVRLGAGSNGQILVASSSATNGVSWATASSGFTFANPMISNGDMIYSVGSVPTQLVGTTSATSVLHGGSIPSWGKIDLANDVTGSLPIANGGTNSSTTKAFAQISPISPTGTASTTGVMMGLANSITPNSSGNILIILSGDTYSTGASSFNRLQIRYGTGSAPANGAAPTGTASGALLYVKMNGAGPANSVPFSLNGIVSGLSVGTTYWVDVTLSSSGGTANVATTSMSAIEL